MSLLYSSPEVMQLPSYPHRIRARSGAPNHDAVQIHVVDFANHRVQQRRVPQPAAFTARRTKSFSLPKPA